MKKLGFKMLFTFALVVPLILMTSQIGFCNGSEPPPEGSRFSGPAIVGSLTVIPTEDAKYVTVAFVGHCKGKQVTLGPIEYYTAYSLGEWTEDTLEGRTFRDAGPPECYSSYGGEMMIINTVTKFNNTGSMVTADMVLLFVVSKSK